MKIDKQTNSHTYWNPYFGGFLLGIIILATFYITGRGLGASGAMKSSVVTLVDTVAPSHAENNAYYSTFISEDDSPMNTWLVYEALGVLIGAFISGGLSGRIRWRVQHSPKISSKRRLVFALLGGVLFGLGAQIARGCTSGAALSGMAVLSTGGFITMLAIFGTAYATAYFFRKKLDLINLKNKTMGPLIPNNLIPLEWNSIIAILIGIVFGFVLEASGFSSSRKLAGVFYGYDFAVLKVFFTAAVVSVIGLYYMDYLGYLDITQLYVHPTYLWGAIIGGAIMGVGFVAGGFCPGTSLCAVAIGKLDAWVYVGGILLGIFMFSELFNFIEPIYDGYFLGNITLMDTFSWNPYWFIFIFSIIAIVAFAFSDFVQKKIKKVFY